MNQRPKIEGRAACLVAACMAATGIGLGCGYQPKAVQAPNYNPRTFADSLLDRFDADGDGVLSRQEAEQAPGLVAAWPRYDLDGDDAVSREELEARAANWAELGDGLTSIMCVVRMDGRQIGDVHVKLVPDESLEGVVKPAEGFPTQAVRVSSRSPLS